MEKNIDGVGVVEIPRGFKEKLSNFWYHYKWHTIVCILLVITITVSAVQIFSKTDYDIKMLYAGGKLIGKTSENGDVAEIVTVMSSLKYVIEDFDKNGEKTVNFNNYYYLSDAEQAELGNDVNFSLLNSDRNTLSSIFEHSEFYLCFVSPAVYEEYKGEGGTMLRDLTHLKVDYPTAEFYADNAIKLSSLDFYSLPGISNLPDDTLIVLRTPNLMATNNNRHKEYVGNAERVLENILSYKA